MTDLQALSDAANAVVAAWDDKWIGCSEMAGSVEALRAALRAAPPVVPAGRLPNAGDVLIAKRIKTGSGDEVPAGWTLLGHAEAATPVVPAEPANMTDAIEGLLDPWIAEGGGYRIGALDVPDLFKRIEALAASPSPDTDREGEVERIAAVLHDGDEPAHELGTNHTVAKGWDCHMDEARMLYDAGLRPSPDTDAGLDVEDPCCERERGLRDERVRTAHFHVSHDGTVRHPATCGECRRLEEQQRGAEAPPR